MKRAFDETCVRTAMSPQVNAVAQGEDARADELDDADEGEGLLVRPRPVISHARLNRSIPADALFNDGGSQSALRIEYYEVKTLAEELSVRSVVQLHFGCEVRPEPFFYWALTWDQRRYYAAPV